MIQGTGSHVGKSYITAGLCRLFYNEGLAVAPFKSQNMALNSFATADGLEIGRAQAVQAMAAGITPTVDMNPILLKPQSDRRSQIIINGRAAAVMDAGAYYAQKSEWQPVWKAALRRLRDQYDLVVIEGAGSPAEINLTDYDIANMAVAREAGAPVLIVTDIDRGGAFASLYGTFALLPEADRRLVRGFIINKFRGDPRLLGDGLTKLEEMTGVPVLGVVPMVDVELEAEDSVGLETERLKPQARVRVAVPRLPRISNFTDLLPLELLKEVAVDYVRSAAELGRPDAVILPGSKSTIADLRWLKESGLAEAIVALAAAGTPVLGLCGGYQMLGELVDDPLGVEGTAGDKETGLDLLPVRSELRAGKTTKQTEATIVGGGAVWGQEAVGAIVKGYEIHAGVTVASGRGGPCLATAAGDDGWAHGNLPVAGTYLHGLFDNPAVLTSYLGLLTKRAGAESIDSRPADFNERIERVADVLRASLYFDRIRRLIDEGVCGEVEVGAR